MFEVDHIALDMRGEIVTHSLPLARASISGVLIWSIVDRFPCSRNSPSHNRESQPFLPVELSPIVQEGQVQLPLPGQAVFDRVRPCHARAAISICSSSGTTTTSGPPTGTARRAGAGTGFRSPARRCSTANISRLLPCRAPAAILICSLRGSPNSETDSRLVSGKIK